MNTGRVLFFGNPSFLLTKFPREGNSLAKKSTFSRTFAFSQINENSEKKFLGIFQIMQRAIVSLESRSLCLVILHITYVLSSKICTTVLQYRIYSPILLGDALFSAVENEPMISPKSFQEAPRKLQKLQGRNLDTIFVAILVQMMTPKKTFRN